MSPEIKSYFDTQTNTISYVISEPDGKHCAIIDSVLNYDPKAGRTSTGSADEIIAYIKDHNFCLEWILETHAHADHISAAPYIKETLGGLSGIGAHITDVQIIFKKIFNVEVEFATDGSQFDRLFHDDDEFHIGEMKVRVMHTPGHTPACVTYLIGDCAFVGDTLFMPDYGTARVDFPGGDAHALYNSIKKILSLSTDTRLFLCHDYLPPGRDQYVWQTTVAEQLQDNVHVHQGVSEKEFVQMRTERDATLSVPTLLFPSVQINMRAGSLPPAEDNGVSYVKIPLNHI